MLYEMHGNYSSTPPSSRTPRDAMTSHAYKVSTPRMRNLKYVGQSSTPTGTEAHRLGATIRPTTNREKKLFAVGEESHLAHSEFDIAGEYLSEGTARPRSAATHSSRPHRARLMRVLDQVADAIRTGNSSSVQIETLIRTLMAAASDDPLDAHQVGEDMEWINVQERKDINMIPQHIGTASQRLSDARKAHHLALIMEEKEALRQRILELEEREAKYLSSDDRIRCLVAECDQLRAENVTLSVRVRELETQAEHESVVMKQFQLSKARVQKLKDELREQREESFQQLHETRRSLTSLAQEVRLLREKEDATRTQRLELESERDQINQTLRSTELTLKQAQEDLQLLQQRYDEVKTLHTQNDLKHAPREEGNSEDAGETRQEDTEINDVVTTLRSTLDDVQEKLDRALVDLATKDEELQRRRQLCISLEQQILQWEERHDENEQYQRALQNVQQQVNGAMDSVRGAHDMTAMVERLAVLEERLKETQALEEQLNRQEDEIALKDHEIFLLKKRFTELEQSITAVSGVLLTLPRSVREMESMSIELQLYRSNKQIPTEIHAELEQRAQLRCIELEAAREQAQQNVADQKFIEGKKLEAPRLDSRSKDETKKNLLLTTLEVLQRSQDFTMDELQGERDRLKNSQRSWTSTDRLGSPMKRAHVSDGKFNKSMADSTGSAEWEHKDKMVAKMFDGHSDSEHSYAELYDSLKRAFQLFDNDDRRSISGNDLHFVLQAAGIEVNQKKIDLAVRRFRSSSSHVPPTSQTWTLSDVLLLASWIRDMQNAQSVIGPSVQTQRTDSDQMIRYALSASRSEKGTKKNLQKYGDAKNSQPLNSPTRKNRRGKEVSSLDEVELSNHHQDGIDTAVHEKEIELMESDILFTFQIFDEDGQGKLDIEQTALALATLGISKANQPLNLAQRYSDGVSLRDFVALCRNILLSAM